MLITTGDSRRDIHQEHALRQTENNTIHTQNENSRSNVYHAMCGKETAVDRNRSGSERSFSID